MSSFMKILISIVLWQIASAHEVCHDTDFSFNGKDEYLEHVGTLPEMTACTICEYVTTNENGFVDGTIGNYATARQPKAIVARGLQFDGKRGFQVIVNGKSKKFESPLQANTEYHLCMAMNMVNGKMDLYVNARHTRSLRFSIRNGKIRGGGKVTLGKAQYGDGNMMNGRLRNFIVWNKKLAAEEIEELYNENECPEGAVLHLDLDHVIPHGLNFQTNGNFAECASSNFQFEVDNKDRVEFADLIPEMEYITICAWITTNDNRIIPGTVWGYFVNGQVDSLLVEGISAIGIPSIRIGINGEIGIVSTSFKANTEYLICLRYFVPNNRVEIFIDGEKGKTINYPDLDGEIPGGGKLILGQRQGCTEGCFDTKRAYDGRIRNMMMWKRLLSAAEMKQIVASNICPTDTDLDSGTSKIIDMTRKECVETEFTLDNSGETTEYVEVEETLPELEYLTACSWMTTDQFGAIPGTVASYASGEVTVMSIGGELGPEGAMLRFVMNGEVKLAKAQFKPNTEYSVCAAFNFKDGLLKTFINGQVVRQVTFNKGTVSPEEGNLVIGQLQTCDDECFDESRGYTGTIRYFTAWGRLLSDEEVKRYSMNPPECRNDAMIVLTPDVAELHSHTHCPESDFTLNNKGVAYEFIEAKQSLPELTELAICAKIATNSDGIIDGTIMSYAVEGQVDVLTIIGGQSQIKIIVNGKSAFAAMQYEKNTEYLLCFLFFLNDNKVEVTSSAHDLPDSTVKLDFVDMGKISGGGKLILGQRQGCLGGCFTNEGFTGNIKNFVVWDRIVDSDHLHEILEEDECPGGHILDVSMGNFNLGTVMM